MTAAASILPAFRQPMAQRDTGGLTTDLGNAARSSQRRFDRDLGQRRSGNGMRLIERGGASKECKPLALLPPEKRRRLSVRPGS